MNRVHIAKLMSAVACLVILAGSRTSQAEDAPAKAPTDLQGTWKLVTIETDGKTREPLGGGTPRWVIKDDKVFYGGEEIVQFKADASTSPRVIDLKFSNPKGVFEAIYVVEKNTLKVCLNKRTEGTKDRPSKFDTTDQADWLLLVFEREKAAPTNATEGLTGYAGIRLRGDDETKAVLVDSPIEGSPAEKAGLKKGDVILKVGATAATDLKTTVDAVRQAKPGDKLEFRISRDGKELTIAMKAGVLPFHWVVGLE